MVALGREDSGEIERSRREERHRWLGGHVLPRHHSRCRSLPRHLSNEAMGIALLHSLRSDAGSDIGEAGKAICVPLRLSQIGSACAVLKWKLCIKPRQITF